MLMSDPFFEGKLLHFHDIYALYTRFHLTRFNINDRQLDFNR